MQIAAYYTSKDQQYDALEIYCSLRNHEISNGAVNYGLLKLFDLHIAPDEVYREMITAIDFRPYLTPAV